MSARRTRGSSPRQSALRTWPARALAGALAAAIALLVPATPAVAYWSSLGTGAGAASTGVLAPPTDVTVPAMSGPDVSVAWTASTGPTPVAYAVERIGTAGTESACGTSVSSPITATSCVDDAVAAGTYTYRVIAVHRSWTATSAASGDVVVSDPTFLGAADSFSVLGVDATNTVSTTTVSGDVGVTPIGAVVGFTASMVGGDIHVNDAAAAAAASAALTAYNDLQGRTGGTPFAGAPAGLTFLPGLHSTGGAMTLAANTTVTLDAAGNADAIFIFQVNGAVTTGANSQILLINGAQASNVYWQVNGASGHGAGSSFAGTILALGAITLGADVQLIGRALSQAAVTLGGNTVRFTDDPPPTVTITGGPAVATKDTTPTIAGTTTAVQGRPVIVTVGTQTLTTTVQADGSWSVDAADLPPATYTITVKIRDAAGNGGTGTQQLTVEVNPPTIDLGSAASYSVLSGSNVVGTGTSTLAGELGVTPGTSVTGFPPGTSSAQHLGDSFAADAASDAVAARLDGDARIAHTQFANPSGVTFHTGVHESAAAVVLTGAITLDAEGDPSAVFIFQINGALTTAAASSVVLEGGAQASNVFWIVTGAVGLGANSSFAGTMLTSEAITIGNLAAVTGRALAGSTITLANNTIAGL